MSTVTKVYTFTNGTKADATEVNKDFDDIYSAINGNLGAANLANGIQKSINGIINVQDPAYNASGLATTFTGSITSGTKALTLTTTPDFVQGQGINLQGALEASSLQVTAPATVSSNVTVTLNGVAFLVAVVNGDTAIQVATKIRAATYAGWTVGGTAGTDTVTFTSTTSGVKTDSAYSAGTTTATGTMITTTQGTADQISTVSSVSGLVVNVADNSTRTISAGTILHDDTVAINAALNAVPSAGGTVTFPAGTYLVQAYGSTLNYYAGIKPKSNTKIIMYGATLQAVTNSGDGYAVVNLNGISNISISGGKISGERSTHGGTTGQFGMGIYALNSSSITLRDIYIQNCWGDGIYISQCTDVFADFVTCNNNRRNGMTLAGCINAVFMGCKFNNTIGTNPQYGVDIEPDTNSEITKNIKFAACEFLNNNSGGFALGGSTTAISNITVTGCVVDTTISAFTLSGNATDVVISNNIVRNCNSSYQCVQINAISNVVISGNIFDNVWFGMNIDNGSNNIKVIGNIFKNSTNEMIVVIGGSNIEISNNTIDGFGANGIHTPGLAVVGNLKINDNTFRTSKGANVAIFIEGTTANVTDVSITNNTCRQIGANGCGYGIYLRVDNVFTMGNDCKFSGNTGGIHSTATTNQYGAGNRNNDGTWSATPNT